MSRPQPLVSSYGAAFTAIPTSAAGLPTQATGHGRAASSKTLSSELPSGPSTVSLFIANLRLLNFTSLPDWPALTAATFGNADAKARIRASEWALYHLFRIYDPLLTSDKLQPFFPPLEPLQSINLRAALYRCLDAMKRNGVLTRETVLRKSMFDDCAGDKFFELCLGFSAVVLRKITVERKHVRHSDASRPIAERLGTAANLNKRDRDSMLPLAVAHKAALSKVLDNKEKKRQSYCRLDDVLGAKYVDLQRRRTTLANMERDGDEIEKLDSLERIVEKNWTGSNELRDSVLMGDQTTGSDGLLAKPFDDIWVQNEAMGNVIPEPSERGVLEDLQHRAQVQIDRLLEWQKCRQMMKAAEEPRGDARNKHAANPPQVRFELHRQLNQEDTESASTPAEPLARSANEQRYDDILATLREELKRSHKTSLSAPIDLPRSAKVTRRQTSVSFKLGTETHAERNDDARQSVVDFVPKDPGSGRPGLARRQSSRSYEQRRVTSQTGVIPLKSEIFSPVKKRQSWFPTQGGAFSSAGSPDDGTSVDWSRRDSQSSQQSGHSSSTSAVGLGIDNVLAPASARQEEGIGVATLDNVQESTMGRITTPNIHTNEMPPSLTERTRKSMALNGGDMGASSLTAELANISIEDDGRPLLNGDAASRRRSTLMERTRHSISLAPQLPVNPQPARTQRDGIHHHVRNYTSLVSAKPFETPQKTRPASVSGNQWLEGVTEEREPLSGGSMANGGAVGRRDITPREKLFAADAQYDSVFRSRPKVAASPVPSPVPMEEDGADDITQSPSVR